MSTETRDMTTEAELQSALPDDLELTLDDVIVLLAREVERLKEALTTWRQLDHPRKDEIIRWHVRTLDERQDKLEDLKTMLLARRKADREVH